MEDLVIVTDKEGVVFAFKEDGQEEYQSYDKEFYKYVQSFIEGLLKRRNISCDKVAFSGSPESLASFISGMFLVYSLENKIGEFIILTDIDFDPYDPDIPPVN